MSTDEVVPGAGDAPAPPQRRLTIDARATGGELLVRLSGELDLGSAPTFQREMARLEATDPAAIRADLSGVRFIDSTGLSLLVELYRRCLAARRALWLTPAAPEVQRMFELTLLDLTLPFAEPAEQLTRAAQSPPD